MKPNTFNHSLLAVGVAALMGISTGAMANTTSGTQTVNNSRAITNVASASFNIGNTAQQVVQSNSVTVNITDVRSFSLTANNADGSQNDDLNTGETVTPEGFVAFTHTLTNTGNLADIYDLSLVNVTSSTDDADYDINGSTVDYQIYNADNTQATIPGNSGTGVAVGNILGAGTNSNIPLDPGQYIVFTINAKTTGNKGADRQDLTLTATSQNIPAADGNVVTNTDQSSTVLPTFSIIKSVDNSYNYSTDSATYSITVTNDNRTTGSGSNYSIAATDITIRDTLPTGLLLDGGFTVDGVATNPTTQTNNSFEFTGIDLAVGADVTITFKVKKDPNSNQNINGVINHAVVEDDLGNGVTIIDSTDNLTSSPQNTATYYPTLDDGSDTTIRGGDSAEALSTIGLTVSNVETIQVPGTTDNTTEAQHSFVVTNNGTSPETGVTFTLTDNGNSSAVKLGPVTINGTTITPAGGVYTVPNTIAAGASVTVNYVVTASGASLNDFEKTSFEATNGTVTSNSLTDTTIVKGLDLLKTQVLDAACDGNADGSFATTDIDATVGQCVIYNIEATNTFVNSLPGNYPITNLVISDDLDANGILANADYESGSTNTGSAGLGSITEPTNNNNVALNTVTTLAPASTADLQFAVKIKQN